jgi:UDP-glucuronate 4-epimerase
MKILITGSAGFIGFHLSKKLLEEGVEVYGIDSINSYYSTRLKISRINILSEFKNFHFKVCDIVDKDELAELFANNQFDIVINLAAQAGVRYSIEKPQKYVNSNLIGFVNILESCRSFGIKNLIYASSSSVYGNSDNIPFNENQNTNKPESLYAATKMSNELMAYSYSQLYDIKAIGLRFFTVYGPWGRPDMAYFSFTKNILENNSIKVFNEGNLSRDFTYIDDIILGINNLIDNLSKIQHQHKIYNLGNNQPVQLMKFINTLEEAIDKKAILEMYPMQPGDVLTTFADIRDAQKDFDYQPKTSIKDGLKEFVNWYKKYH